MLTTADKDTVKITLSKCLGSDLEAIYLFGSQLGNLATADSDIDLAFVMKKSPDPDAVYQAKTELAYKLKSDVDLVDLWRSDTVTKAQVISSGELLFAVNSAEMAQFETVVLSQYALLNEERAGILADIATKGSIHG